MEGGQMLNKLHTKRTMKQQNQASKDKSDALLCQAETKKNNGKPIEMHSHVMCLQTIENKSMLMHSNHRPKPMLPIMKLNQIQKIVFNCHNSQKQIIGQITKLQKATTPNNDPGQRNHGKVINPRIFQQSKTEPES
jgi:hypothetical protein